MRFKKRIVISIFIMTLTMITSKLLAGKLKIAPDQQFLLLATTKISTMEKELSQAASQGFRVIAGSPTSGMEMVLLLERTNSPTPYQYKLLATNRTSTFQKELDEASSQGYRLLPSTMIAKKGIFTVQIVAVMEKHPNSTYHFKYLLLATIRTRTLQKEITKARKKGFTIAGLISRGEHMVIMEKEIEN